MVELLSILMLFLSMFLMGVCILIGWWIVWGRAAADARELRRKFISLGTVAGKRLAQIEQAVGKPKSWTTIGQNRFHYRWSTQTYSVILTFQGDVCEGISSEISV